MPETPGPPGASDPPGVTGSPGLANLLTYSASCYLFKVLLTLKKDSPFLVFQLSQLGVNTKVRKYDMCATTYINEVSMKSLDFTGLSGFGFVLPEGSPVFYPLPVLIFRFQWRTTVSHQFFSRTWS